MKIKKPLTNRQVIEYLLENNFFESLNYIHNFDGIENYLDNCEQTLEEYIEEIEVDKDIFKAYTKLKDGEDYSFIELYYNEDNGGLIIDEEINKFKHFRYFDLGEGDRILFCYK